MLKKMITILLFSFTSLLKAPDYPSLVIVREEKISPYERILNAVSEVESKNGAYLFNEKENAVGWFAIRPIRLLDYNQRTGKSITLSECYDYETGKMIFLYYASAFQPYDYEGIAKDWNKSRTDGYWEKVKIYLK